MEGPTATKKVAPSNSEYRQIRIDRGRGPGGGVFPLNYISTGKYTVFSLLPKNLFEQFHRVANIWFLIVSIFQVLPFQLSPTSSWATIAPLSLVLTVTLVKDAYLDYRRHKSDRTINNRPIKYWSEDEITFKDKRWRDLEVGNLVLLVDDEDVPADLVVLVTSDPEQQCNIETANLDGESNLKIRTAVHETSVVLKNVDPSESMLKLHHLDEALLKSEHPNNRLYTFEASLKLKSHPRQTPLDNNNILLRGSTLKNTKWIIGVVVFTGSESKLMMNSKTPPHKRSNIERRVNKYLAIVFSILFFAAAVSTSISIVYAYTYPDAVDYFASQDSSLTSLNFITFMILYNGLVPISLYVTMDIVRVIQAKFIQWDLRMYHEESNTPALAKTGDLNEDLGQIEFVFSDKTGTLTENVMEFKRCAIGGKLYGHLQPNPNAKDSQVVKHSKFTFTDPTLLADLQTQSQGAKIETFLELLALCHTVIPVHEENGNIKYQAASPDEEALVVAAHCFGFSFTQAKSGHYVLNINGENKEYKIIGTNDFNSTRKRMSVVIQPITDSDRQPVLYCKGADNVMLDLVLNSTEEIEKLNRDLYDFSVQGLRTLVCAKRNLTLEEAEDFEKKWQNARCAMADRAKWLEEVALEFETDLELVGATAIEDKIQDGVPETISKLMEGGIKVWVLTGDKRETAINIGYSCKLLKQDMTVIQLSNIEDVGRARSELRIALATHIYARPSDDDNVLKHVQYIAPNRSIASDSPSFLAAGQARSMQFSKNTNDFEDFNQEIEVDHLNLGLVVDGMSLEFILNDTVCMKYFSMLSCLCHAVICCRVSPLQKADVVKLVKNHFSFKPMTLAIGDGANDVSMIQEAHVGIGISGKEGMQAVNSSDYAIARFKYLLPLLFVHGRWNYQRISRVICYSFYKNFLLILPMFYFSFANQYSGTALYDSWLIMSYNVAFTSLPIMILGIMDKDCEAEYVLNCPKLYTEGVLSKNFNAKIFLKWTLFAILQSLVVFFLVTVACANALDSDGNPEDLMMMGTLSFICVVHTVTYVIWIEMKDWTKVFGIISELSCHLLIPFIFFYDYAELPSSNLIGISSRLFNVPVYFLTWTMTPLACILINLSNSFITTVFFPSTTDKLLARNTSKVHPTESLPETRLKLMRAAEYKAKLGKVFDEKGCKKAETSIHSPNEMLPLTLKFADAHQEKSYKNYIVSKSIRFVKRMFVVVFIFNLIWTIADLISTAQSEIYIAARIVIVVVFGFVVVFTYTHHFAKYYETCILTILIVGLAAKILSELYAQNDGSMSTALVPIITFVLFNVSSYKILIINIIFMAFYLLRVFVTYGLEENGIVLAIIIMNYMGLLIGILVVSTFVGYALEKSKRLEFVLHKNLEQEYQKGQDILSNLLPKFVKDRVKQGVRYIAEDQGIVTVLFCDIYGFDRICATHTPQELTDWLDGFFALMDQICDKHGVTKIETVGKTYLACGGLKDSEANMSPMMLKKNHAVRVVEMALNVLKRLEPVCLKTGESFQVKIGINSGRVIAGVVGDHKPQFALVGDTINTASRMGSTIKAPNMIQISAETYEFVKNEPWNFSQDQVEAKGKGLLTTYYVSNIARNSAQVRVQSIRDVMAPRPSITQIIPPPSPDPLDQSNLPLIETKEVQEEDLNKSSSAKETGALHEISNLNREDMEELGLAGPVQWLNCSIIETNEQKEYRVADIQNNMTSLTSGLWMSIVIYTFLVVIFIIAFSLSSHHGSGFLIALRSVCIFSMFVLVFTFKKWFMHFSFPWVMTIVYVATSFTAVVTMYTIDEVFVYIVVLEVMYTNVVVNHISDLPFGYILIANICIIMPWLIVFFNDVVDFAIALESTFFLMAYMLINGAASFSRENQERITYNLNKLAEREIQNTMKLLNQMMPAHVVKNLEEGVTTTDRYNDITMIFADICGFTNWSSKKTPMEVVSMLNKLFKAFDHLCVKNSVYKVHTIGDCYVILGFTNKGVDLKRDPAAESTNMINMALDMIKAIKKINRSKGLELNMRIGLHTGDLIAGITGTNIVRYDIYGPDVDIANKMESNGQPGRINVSEVTRDKLEVYNSGRFEYHFNKIVTHEPVNRSLNSFFIMPLLPEDKE